MTDPLMSQRTNGGGGGYSSAGLTWPRRVRPNSLSFRPLRSANPGQSPEGNMDPTQPFLSPPIQQRSGYVSPLRAVRTLKEYDQEIDGLRKENFNLKLSLYFLERDMEKMTNPQERETLKVSLQLRIEVETLRNEVANKATMLHESMVALEKLEEKYKLELQHSKDTQMQLEGKIDALKQELEKERMQTPRSSDAGSEIYRQAFGMEESLSGKSSPEYEVSLEQMKSQYLAALEKLQCTVDEKDKEIKNMRTTIEDLDKKNQFLEEKVRKRNTAIQGLLQVAKKKENSNSTDQPQGFLQKSLMQAIEAAHTGNRDSVVSNIDDIRKGLSGLLSVTGSEVALGTPEDVENLKSEISRKDEVIQTLEEQLIDQTKRVKSLEENANGSWSSTDSTKVSLISSKAILEQECKRLQKAVREKDHFIQELLDERTKMTSEHEKTVQSLVSRLQLQNESERGKIKDSDIYDSESLKMLQELICEKDAEIDVRKKTIEMLNFQLAKCQSELQTAIISSEEKERKLLELSSRSLELQNELVEIQHEMQALKAAHQSSEKLLVRDSFGSDQSNNVPKPNVGEISKPLIDFDDSLKSTSVSEKKHASLTEIKELQRSLEESMPVGAVGNDNMESHVQHSSAPGIRVDGHLRPDLPSVSGVPAHRLSVQQPSSVHSTEISEIICLRTPRKETIKLSLNVSKKVVDDEKSEDLLDIMENNIEEFERQKLLHQLEDRNIEIVKLGRRATLQEDMASVLVEDKKRLQQEIEEKASEVQMLTAGCSELEKQVIALQSQLHGAAKRADELERIVHDSKSKPKSPVPKSSAAIQTDSRKILTRDSECNTTFSDLKSSLNNFGQSDNVNTLKEEICILILMVEEKDKEILLQKQSINKLKSELKSLIVQTSNTSQLFSGYSEGLSTVHQQLNESQNINSHLFQHLQEVARFMESLLPDKEKQKLDVSSLTPEAVSHIIKHVSDSMELAENLSQNLTSCEESKIFDPDEYSRVINESLVYPQAEFFRSSRTSLGADEDFMSSSRRTESEGSELQVVPHQQNANGAGKSWKWTSTMQHKPAMDTVVETIDSDQLTILGASCSDEGMCCLNEGKVPNLDFNDELPAVSRSRTFGNVRSSVAEVEMRKNYLSHLFQDSVQFECDLRPQHLCWYGKDKGEHVLHSRLYYPDEMDIVLPLETYQKCSGVPCCNISSDSDIWSEPDRNLSLQRIGIDLEAPSFHTRSPPKRRRSNRDRQFSDDCSSDNSFSINGIPKGKSCPRRKKSIGSFKRSAMEPKLDILMESRLLALERSIEDKLGYVQKLSETVQDDLSGLTGLADESPNQIHALMNINQEINNLQSTLANAVEEVKILKDTTQESSQLSQDRSLTEELKLYNEEILSKIDDIDQMKEILVKERYARETAEQNLYSCHQELLAVKRKLGEAMLKLQEKSPLKHIQGLGQEAGHTPEISKDEGTQADVDHLRKSLAQEKEQNVFLNKHLNDILNENKKLKIEFEQLHLLLTGEQRNLEEVRQQLMSEQDMVKHLSKEKNASESKSVDLTADMMRMRASLTELQDQNKALNKQVSDLLNQNKKMKLEVEESQIQLNSEREQVEKLSTEHLHKQESLGQLTKDKLVAENKIASLTVEVETLKTALSQKEDQNSCLNKQVNDLRNDNWKIKKELEQLELRLRTEVEHLEAMRKAKNDLHKQNLDLTTVRGDLEKQLHHSEERMKMLADEKTDLSKRIFEEQRESKNLFDKVKVLEDQKALLEKEISKYKIEIHSSDSVCDEAKYDLKHTKEKLKKLELVLHQYETELTKATTSNEHLMSEKKSLLDELESLASKAADLSKQNGETKKLLKQRTSSYNEIEREKSLLVDQIENLKIKKVQAESSRDKLIVDYDSLAEQVDSLERQLKDSDMSLQKNKDEQEHVRQQVTSLQNKIKLKESVIKDLEEQHDVLHEQLKDLQHSLNKNDIDLKHLEDENHSLELQILTLQKQIKKTSSQLEVKDDEISHLQEEIFSLEQKVKDKEVAHKRTIDEKKMSEEQILHLQQELKKQESFRKQMKQQTQELEEQVSGLELQLQSKELLRRKSEEEAKSMQTKVEEKEKSVKKLESTLKKMEHKLSAFQDTSAQLQQRMKQAETSRKFSDEQTAVYREELNKLREAMLMKTRKEEPASTDRLSIVIDQLNNKEEYCKALENKIIEYQKQIVSLQREYDRTTPAIQFREPGVVSAESVQIPLVPNKVFSEPRSSQDYRLHTESKAQVEKDNFIKGLELDNSDLKHQLQVLNKKFSMAEKVKNDLEEENVSLWKTLYGSQDEKTDIIKTLELKNNDLKNQVVDLERKQDSSEKLQQELEEENNSLRKTLFGKEGGETDMIKRLDQKNEELRNQLEVFQSKLKEAEESKQNLREEKDSLWKTIHGKKDEKTDLFKKLQMKNNDFKGQIEDLQKKLDASEKARYDLDEEKNSLWKALYGQHDDKTDITKLLELKNNELKVKTEVLEKKLSHCEKAKLDVEEKKNTLWKTLYGSQDEKMEAMKMMEEKNNELKGQIAIIEKKLSDADKIRVELEDEKNSMWKTLCGSEDEKTDLLQQMEMKNTDLKGEIETLKRELISAEKVHKEIEEEKSSLWKTLYGSEHEQADIIRNLEVKNNDLKGQVHILEKKLDASEKVKKDLEERINSLRVTLYGSQDEKADAIRSIELKNSDLLAQVEVLKRELTNLEKDKNEVEEEKASLWRTLCGNEDEKTDVMRQMEQKNNNLSDQIQVLKKKLSASEKTVKEIEEEKASLWKTLYGSEHEQSDMIKRLEQKNKDLNDRTGELERKLNDSEKAQKNLEEEKGSLWMAVHGTDDEKTHEIKSLEMKNSDLKSQLDILEKKLSVSEKLKSDFEEEKNSLWKNMYGSQDEKASAIKKLNMEISNLKSLIQNLENKLSASEKAKNDLEVEKSSLNEKLSKSIEENANIRNKLELKDSDLKEQMRMLEEKLKVSEDLKAAIEEDRNSLYKQLLGDSGGAKLEGMLKETQIYIDQVKKLEQEIGQKNALLSDMKEQLFVSENSLATQQSVVECLNKEISNYKVHLGKAHAEREWFQNQYIDSQREVIRATQSAAVPGSEIHEEDMMVVHQENVDLKKQVTELLSQLNVKDTPLSLPPIKTELFTVELPTLPDEKMESSVDRRVSSEMKRAELEKLHIEKNYLQKVLTDLKKQVESQPPRRPDADIKPEKMPIQKQQSDFSEIIAKQLVSQGFSDAAVKEQVKQLQSERDYFKNLVDKLQTDLQLQTLSLREKGPATFTEAENVKLRKENDDLKGKLVELHSRVKKRESLIIALSNKVVELSKSLQDSQVTSEKELSKVEREVDDVSLLASQIVEESSKTAERSLSEGIVIPDIGFGFEPEQESQLLSLLHPSLRRSISQVSEVSDIDAKSVQKLRYQIEELENQLEYTKMDNYRLQEEVNNLLFKFGIQNNQLVCEKCGKSADIISTHPSVGVKSVSKFTSFRRYLEKDPMFSKEESVNKLSECKWKLQNEVLNMQKKLCVNKPSYLENQENFNEHITKIVDMEYPKIPVRIFSEPLLPTAESQDIMKNAERLELLWKNQMLHLKRDIMCLQNYRMFLEQFVLNLMKEQLEATKEKPTVVSRGTDIIEEQSLIPEMIFSVREISKPLQTPDGTMSAEAKSEVKSLSLQSLSFTPENGIPPHKAISSQKAQLLKDLPADRPIPSEGVQTDTSSLPADDRMSVIPEQRPSVPVLAGETSATEKLALSGHDEPSSQVVVLQNKIKELNKKIERLQSENKRLQAENNMLSTECKKSYRSKHKEERLMEKEIEDLKHSLKNMKSVKKSMQLELDMYHQMFQADNGRDKPAEKYLDGYVKKSCLVKVMNDMKSMSSELDRLSQENSMLRKKLIQLASPASRAVKSRILLREESSSDKESEGTVTLSRSESLSSLESVYQYEMHEKKSEGYPKHHMGESTHYKEPWDLPDFQFGDQGMPLTTTQRRRKSESIQEHIFPRSHFSSPDLGIESDPNHELLFSEQQESDEKTYVKSRPSRQPVTPSRTKPGRSTAAVVTAMWDSVKTAAAVGASLHAMGPLKDYNLLKKEIEESLVLIKVMSTRARECVEHLSRGPNPNKNLGYTTLKEILSNLSDVNVCQVKAQQLARSFWVSSAPSGEESAVDVTALLQEHQELLRRLEFIMEERKSQKLELEQAFERLRDAQESKQKMEKAITKQLTRTKKVLTSARSNLQGPQQRPGASSNIPLKKNNPSLNNKPSTK